MNHMIVLSEVAAYIHTKQLVPFRYRSDFSIRGSVRYGSVVRIRDGHENKIHMGNIFLQIMKGTDLFRYTDPVKNKKDAG
jgi:hypothetical protein